MALKTLVETGFMLALNQRDRHHEWAMRVLNTTRRGGIVFYASPVVLASSLISNRCPCLLRSPLH